MKLNKILQTVLLVILLLALTGLYVLRLGNEKAPESLPAPEATAAPTPTPAPTPEPTPEPTPTPTPEPTPEPVYEYTFSFAGDCTLGSLLEWQGNTAGDFQSTVGTDYAKPLAAVQEYFANDDFTMVNLEGTFTDSTTPVYKNYRFKADPAYAQILSLGSVEGVSVANNHAGDFQEEGREDTKAALDAVGVRYTDAAAPLIFEMEGGMKVGIVTYNTVENTAGEAAWRASVEADIALCKEDDCDLILGFMHWGTMEYLQEPEAWEVQLAHDMVDWGCDMIVGGHAHILQRMEYYNNVPIFYSMGNFCYGGHLNPNDKDSVIVQADFRYDAAADTAELTDVRVVPCSVSSDPNRNDYCPTPYEPGSDAYNRVLTKLRWTEE